MSCRKLFLIVASGCLLGLVACGGTAAPAGDEGKPDIQATQLPTESATGGVREGAGQTTRGRGRSASSLHVVIASCEWQAGGQLDLTFTIENAEDVLRFGNFRLKSASGAIYRPPGVKSDISVPPGETREYSASADKFPAGSELSLVVSDSRRESHTVPVEGCK